jgi:N-acetylglucosaminyldiphosphoundecaprenol N-acetyl-beta-D-mannosaminyltransferase
MPRSPVDHDPGSRGVAAAPQPPHDEFLGLAFSRLSLADAAGTILDRPDAGYAYVVTPNAPHVVTVHRESELLLPVYRGAWLSLCDSQVVRRLARLRGLSLPLVTGSDLVAALLDAQNTPAPRGGRKRVLVFGPDEEIEAALHRRYPRADIAVLGGPKGLARSAQLRADAARACLAREWDILLLCVGCPAQELIADQLRQQGCRRGVALCVGASIDFVVGRSIRAPRIFSRLGIEWAFRLALEPRRLWRRYLIEAPQILRIFFSRT